MMRQTTPWSASRRLLWAVTTLVVALSVMFSIGLDAGPSTTNPEPQDPELYHYGDPWPNATDPFIDVVADEASIGFGSYNADKADNDVDGFLQNLKVSSVSRALPNAAYASSDRALELKHIDTLQPATVNVDEMMEWVKAKMGRGLETVLDESRRRCKVLVPKAAAESDSTTTTTTAAAAAATSAAPVAAARPNIVHWPGLEAALESTRKQLCPWFPPASLHAHLHTVQQYDEGDFFTLHRDAPKLPYHIITLSVDCSPPGMTHKGGEIVVGGAHIKFSGSGSFAAWFATTYHEVLPVTKGRRMSATFNIAVDPAVATAFTCDNPTIEQAVDKAAVQLRRLEPRFAGDRHFALDTEYAFDPTIGVAQHIFELQGRDRLMHEAMCRAFDHGRVVLSAHQRGARGVRVLIEESMVADGASYYSPEREYLRDDAEDVDNEEHRAVAPSAKPAAPDAMWRAAYLSLKPKSKKDKDKKEE